MATRTVLLEALPFRCVSLCLAALDEPVFIRVKTYSHQRWWSDGLTWPKGPEVHRTKCKVRW